MKCLNQTGIPLWRLIKEISDTDYGKFEALCVIAQAIEPNQIDAK